MMILRRWLSLRRRSLLRGMVVRRRRLLWRRLLPWTATSLEVGKKVQKAFHISHL